MAKGIIYLMSTVVDGLVKIGKTGSDNFEQRMSNLERNGYRNVSGLKREFAIEVDDYDEKEILIDSIFSKSRVGDTEMFSLDINLVKQFLASLEGKIVYPENEKKEEVFGEATEAIESALIPEGTYTYAMKSQKDKNNYSGVLVCKEGKLILQKGAVLAPLTECGSKNWIKVRQNLKLVDGATIEEIPCSSVSEAANFICGHRKNGWKAWKDSEGNFIDIYRKK